VNLLVVSSWWPCPADNGSRVRALELVRELAKRHVVTMLAFGRAGDEQEDWRPLDRLCRTVHVVRAAGHASAIRRLAGWLSPVPRHFVQTDSPVMRRLVRKLWPGHDAAIALQIDAARYVATADLRIPRVFEEVELTVPRERVTRAARTYERVRHGLTWMKHKRFVRRLVEHFDAATVVSQHEKAMLEAIGADARRIRVVPNGVRVDADPIVGQRVNRVIYPGSIRYAANLDAVRYFVREILPQVRRASPSLEFVVTGDTGTIDLREFEMPGVRFTGLLPDVGPLIRESAACVVPLRIGGGTRLKVLQAMALGTPVISTSKGIEGLELQSECHAMVADAADAFARGVLALLNRPDDASRMAGAALALVRDRYDWTASGEALECALEVARDRFARARRDRT